MKTVVALLAGAALGALAVRSGVLARRGPAPATPAAPAAVTAGPRRVAVDVSAVEDPPG